MNMSYTIVNFLPFGRLSDRELSCLQHHKPICRLDVDKMVTYSPLYSIQYNGEECCQQDLILSVNKIRISSAMQLTRAGIINQSSGPNFLTITALT